MTTVLVVDDTDFDREIASHLIRTGTEWNVLTAGSADAALSLLADQPVDLVVSDVQMPGMNGLELLNRLQTEHPLTPVVMVTSYGSEALAVQALREGAASYVPKANLQRDLIETLETVLDSAARCRNKEHLMSCLTHQQQTFEIPNVNGLIPHVVGALQECIARLNVCDERDRVRIGVAVEEALVNALVHGNLEVSSELRERFDDSFSQLVEERKRQSPYCDRRIFVTLRADRDEVMIQIRDQGPGFDISKLSDPTDPENLGRCSGRGILLMRSFLDEVIFNDLGNQVTMIKRRKKPATAEPEQCAARPHVRVRESIAS